MRCTSRGSALTCASRCTIGSPNVRFGTKWLSITSQCTRSAEGIRAISAAKGLKSADRMLGSIRTALPRPYAPGVDVLGPERSGGAGNGVLRVDAVVVLGEEGR